MNKAIIFVSAWLCLCWALPKVSGEPAAGFREVLALADIDPNQWPIAVLNESEGQTRIDEPVWQLCQQLLFRLRQFPKQQLRDWAHNQDSQSAPGSLAILRGEIISVSKVEESHQSSESVDSLQLYLCKYEDESADGQGYVLVPQIPSQWQVRTSLKESIQFVGIVLDKGTSGAVEPLLLTDRIEWYPSKGVSSGLLLLSEQGMDVSLLDEVRHRQAFVKANVSREGDAFYACLAAMANVDQQKLEKHTLINLDQVANQWEAGVAVDKKRLGSLRRQLRDASQETNRPTLEKEIANTRRRLAIAAAVEKQAARQVSSVAPLFIQPEEEAGQLVRIEGLARRAVWIAADKPQIEGYYELEVFTSDSQNLPVVCCTAKLPQGFPTEDEIRESVQIDGVFFKSWRYRTRKNIEPDGQTVRQQQLYTPIVIGPKPIWLRSSSQYSSSWAIVGGLGVVVAFGFLWMQVVRSSRRTERKEYSLDLSKLDQHLESETKESLP